MHVNRQTGAELVPSCRAEVCDITFLFLRLILFKGAYSAAYVSALLSHQSCARSCVKRLSAR